MTDSDQNLPNEQQIFISQFTQSIQLSLQSLLNKYQIVASESSSQEALSEIQVLDDEVSQLLTKIQEICSYQITPESLDRDREKLKDLQKELQETIQVLRALKENVDNLKRLTEDLMLDPQEDDKLEIIDVDTKGKDKSSIIWTVTIKSNTKNKGNFRDVKIMGSYNKSPVCTVLLIEPGMTIKVQCDLPLQVGEVVSAEFKNCIVSDKYYIFSLKIVEVAENTGDMVIKNLSSDDVLNFGIFLEGVTLNSFYNIGAYEIIRIKNNFPIEANRVVLYDASTSYSISNYYQIKNAITPELQRDLTPDQRANFNTFMEKNPQADPIQVKLALIKGEIINN